MQLLPDYRPTDLFISFVKEMNKLRVKFFHTCTSIGSANLYSWLVVDIRYVGDPSFEEKIIMASLICDTDLIATRF